ncbi:MAG: dihydrolipoyl dehydrogenase [Candidatus Woesearchaeota archaeon]
MEKRFDAIIIGAGSGLIISSYAAERGLKVAIVEQGPFGGTCLNRGCIPSKMLIRSADVIDEIKRAQMLGINAKVEGIDWQGIIKRAASAVDAEAKEIEQANRHTKNITVYKATAKFVGKKKLKVGKHIITADKIFICAGTRPFIPKIPGLDKVGYITSDEAMRLKKQPESIIIIGGGYIAAELAHFFGSLGTKVTIIQRSNWLLTNEDSEIAQAFTRIFARKHKVLLDTNVVRVFRQGKNIAVECETKGKKQIVSGKQLLVATGRVPNTDILDVAKTGIITYKNGFITTDAFMETNVPGIWAIGDIAGVFLFKHSANLEASYAVFNALNPKHKMPVPYDAMPHAIFSSPQIAGVGMTEDELKEKKIPYVVGRYKYYDTAYGKSIEDKDGFVKVLVHPKTREILGCHILGSDASILIQEVVVAMKGKLGADGILGAVHVHPALPEVVQRAFWQIRDLLEKK